MGLFFAEIAGPDYKLEEENVTLREMGCRACPLAEEDGGDMPATGPLDPLIYVLGESPGAREIDEGKQFVGASGELLRKYIPREFLTEIRWNNVVRSRPPGNRDPDRVEIECFPGDTLVVPIGGLRKIYRRWYDGKLIKVTTISGRVLSGSPNHPVLTQRGTVALKLLMKGDNLVRTSRRDMQIAWSPDQYGKPTKIGELFGSLTVACDIDRVLGETHDFHGDGMNSNVDIVDVDSLLRDRAQPTLFEQASKPAFPLSYSNLRNLMIDSPLAEHVLRKAKASWSTITQSTFFSRMLAVPKLRGLSLATFGNFMLSQDAIDDTPRDAVVAAKLLNIGPVEISLDEVALVEVCDFSGHLYNLQTGSGYYSANGFTVKNCCRLSVIADIEATKPKVIFGFGAVPLHWVSGFHGIASWRGRRMPVRVGAHTCWYYAFYHPAYLLHMTSAQPRSAEEIERSTAFDLERAFSEIDHLPSPIVHDAEKALSGVDCLTTLSAIENALSWAARLPYVGVDYETNCLRPYEAQAKILSAAVATLDRAFAFPLEHPSSGFTDAQMVQVRDLWRKFLTEAPCRKVVHNLSFEMEWSASNFGPHTLHAQPWADTAVAASILDERIGGKPKPGCFALEFLVQQYYGFNVKRVSNVDRTKLQYTPIQDVLSYNAIDAKYHAGLWQSLWPIIKSEKLEDVYELSVRRVPTIVLSQMLGVPVNQARVEELQNKYDKLIRKTERAIANLDVAAEYEQKRGKAYNPYSVPETIYVFETLLRRDEIRVLDKFSGRETRSVKEEVLERINHPLARNILNLRLLSGTKSKYIDPLLATDPDSAIFADGLVHTNYNTYGTVTGRLSCSAPWTEVRTKRGIVQIKDVVVDDLVWTHRQRWRRVTAAWCKGTEQMLDVYLSNGKVLTCTKNHLVLSRSAGWITVGELYALLREMGGDTIEHKARPGALSQQGLDPDCTNSEATGYASEQHLRSHSTTHACDREESVVRSALLGFEAWRKKSDAGQDRLTTSQLEGRMFRWQRLLDYKGWLTTYLCPPLPAYASVGTDRDPFGLVCASYRWRSTEQRRGQFSLGDQRRSSGYSLQAAGDQDIEIEKIQVGGSFEVFDLAVADDASYETYGIFSHNSDRPNLQNYPHRDEDTKEVRSSIVAPPGCVCLSFDYGQIEARVAAMFTKDPRFVKILWDRYDIHGDWAKRIATAYPAVIGGAKNLTDKVAMKKFRNEVKNGWTFPLIYGARCSSVAGYLNVPEDKIEPLYTKFWEEFADIRRWQQQLIKFYRNHGYVECLTGRRRHAPLSDNMVYNSPVQGTAAEIVMDAMCRLSETGDPELQPELQIHDDLTFLRVPIKRVDFIAEQVIDHMLAVPFKWAHIVPITIEMKVGRNWDEMEEVGSYSSDTWRK